MDKPIVQYMKLESGRHFVRFRDIEDAYWYDNRENNPNGLGMGNMSSDYVTKRGILSDYKLEIIKKARAELNIDKEFLELVYKGKSDKRMFTKNKFCGSFSPVSFAKGEEKIFTKSSPGAKKKALNMAFQVGVFSGGNYEKSFINITKTILAAQALGISLNIDMFDSDPKGINHQPSYVLINVAKSSEKLNFRKILACSDERFFNVTLFNGYCAAPCWERGRISAFLPQEWVVQDLGQFYDVIGGNILSDSLDELSAKVLKIGFKG